MDQALKDLIFDVKDLEFYPVDWLLHTSLISGTLFSNEIS